MAKLKIDQEKCIGCGTCAAIYPDYFTFITRAQTKDVSLDKKLANDIVKVCPVDAISVSEE
jgi:ferredoxin